MNTSTSRLPRTVSAYIRATNAGDAAAFITCFTDGAVVDDAGREFRGIDSIRAWSEREIFAPRVTLQVLGVTDLEGETMVTTKVDGNFDRTGLPDPVVINHHFQLEADQISRLTCRLAGRDVIDGGAISAG